MNNYRNDGFNAIPAVTKSILIINVIIWLASYFFWRGHDNVLVDILGLYYIQSPYFHWFQYITYMFTHVEFTHIFFNMFAAYMFGVTLERVWGSKRYLFYYLFTGVGAGLIQTLVSYLTGNYYGMTIGASGAVYGILLAFGMMYPNVPLYILFIPVPIKAKYFVVGYGLIELFLGFANRAGDNVAHFAHLGGMLFGIILILYWNHIEKKGRNGNSWWKSFSNIFKSKSSLHTNHSSQSRFDSEYNYNAKKNESNAEIDAILEKIKRSGYDSLTKEEKQKLFDASKK